MSGAEDRTLRTGACLCGAVKLSFTADNRLNACHCSMCRAWTGGPWIVAEAGSGISIEGEEHVIAYESSDWATRGFCGKCGTHLYYRFNPTGDYSISSGLITDAKDVELRTEIFFDEKPGYYEFTNDTHRMTGAEVIARFSGGGD